MTPERIREVLPYYKSGMPSPVPDDYKIIKEFWFNTGCLAKDLIASSDDELNELWARFVFDRIAETKEA